MTDLHEPNTALATRDADILEIIPAGTMTYEEFLKRFDGMHAEWVDGEVLVYMSASFKHQYISTFLVRVIGDYVESKDLGVVLHAPFQMKLSAKRGREPDLLFISKARQGLIQENFLDGYADLAIEIISPESVGRDKTVKLAEYQTVGVLEYWLIDPQLSEASFYHLENKQYQQIKVNDEGKYFSKVLTDFWLNLNWLWQENLPEVEDVLIEIGGEAYMRRLLEKFQKRGML